MQIDVAAVVIIVSALRSGAVCGVTCRLRRMVIRKTERRRRRFPTTESTGVTCIYSRADRPVIVVINFNDNDIILK